MKRTILFLAIFFSILDSTAQPYFNRIYRLDSRQGNATVYKSLRTVNNTIYMAGVATFNVTDSTLSNSGIFTSFDMAGNIIKNTYYGVIPNNSDFNDDVLQIVSDNEFSLAGYNFSYSFTHLKINNNGNIIWQRKHLPDTISRYGTPSSLIKIANKYLISLYKVVISTNSSNLILFMTDLEGNHLRSIEFTEDQRANILTQVIQNKNKNLALSLFKTDHNETDTDYVYISQLREIDTLGNTLWVYNTPRDRFIYIKKFVQLANGNYLVWGDEELSKNVWGGTYWYRSVYDAGAYLAEINPQRGIIWEKRFNLGKGSRMYGFKILKDSSMVLTCFYADGFNNSTAALIKLNSHYDSLYRRDFRTTSITSGRVIHYPNQIEELANGDLLIGGYVWDLPVSSPTTGQWGWLVRTDSMGCSLEPSSCRTPTKDIENAPLSIKVFPNPASDKVTIESSVPLPKSYFQLYNTLGQTVLKQKLNHLTDRFELDIHNLPNGLYLFTLYTEGGHLLNQSKIQVQR